MAELTAPRTEGADGCVRTCRLFGHLRVEWTIDATCPGCQTHQQSGVARSPSRKGREGSCPDQDPRSRQVIRVEDWAQDQSSRTGSRPPRCAGGPCGRPPRRGQVEEYAGKFWPPVCVRRSRAVSSSPLANRPKREGTRPACSQDAHGREEGVPQSPIARSATGNSGASACETTDSFGITGKLPRRSATCGVTGIVDPLRPLLQPSGS